EVVHLLPVCDAGKRAILSADTHARVQHHGYEKACLTFREPQQPHGSQALLRGHSSSSSANRGSKKATTARMEPTPTRLPTPRMRVNRATISPAAFRPR